MVTNYKIMVDVKIGRVARGHEVQSMIRGGQDISMTNTTSHRYRPLEVKMATGIGGIMTVGMIAEASEETEETGATTDTMIRGMEDQEGMVIGMEFRLEANTGEGEDEVAAGSISFRLRCQSTRVITDHVGVRSA